jgi:hypothetical protein
MPVLFPTDYKENSSDNYGDEIAEESVYLTTHFHLVLKLMLGFIPPLSHMPSWH